MNTKPTEKERLLSLVKELKLPTFKDTVDTVTETAVSEHWTYPGFLCEMMAREVAQRYENRKYQRIRKASFPQLLYLDALDRTALPIDAQKILPEFETLDFIRDKRNIIMYGNPGTGKTHIATGLGIKACLEGFSVFFTTVPALLTKINEAKNSKTLQSLEFRFKRYDLVILDEMGYVTVDRANAEMLFNHLSLRSGNKSTVITTNLPFTRWEEIMKDKVLCSALVDRLCHKAHMVNMTGKSYRTKETESINIKL